MTKNNSSSNKAGAKVVTKNNNSSNSNGSIIIFFVILGARPLAYTILHGPFRGGGLGVKNSGRHKRPHYWRFLCNLCRIGRFWIWAILDLGDFGFGRFCPLTVGGCPGGGHHRHTWAWGGGRVPLPPSWRVKSKSPLLQDTLLTPLACPENFF